MIEFTTLFLALALGWPPKKARLLWQSFNGEALELKEGTRVEQTLSFTAAAPPVVRFAGQ